MNTRFLEAFLWVVRLRSFRRAAERLHMSQAAISSRIAALEGQLGCVLIDRTSRLVQPTQAGQTLISHAERVLTMQDDLLRALATSESVGGTVRLGVVETIVHTFLVRLTLALQSAYPGIALEITAEPTRSLHEHLRRGSIDIAVATEPLRDPDIQEKPLCHLRMGWIRRKSAEELDETAAFSDLLDRPIITFPKGSVPYGAVRQIFADAGREPQTLHCVTSIAAIMRLVHADLGTASMPLAAVRDELNAGLVSIVAPRVALPDLPLFLCNRPDPTGRAIDLVAAAVQKEAEAFCDLVGDRFAWWSNDK